MRSYFLLVTLSLCIMMTLTSDVSAELIAYEGFDVVGLNEGGEVCGLAGETSFGFSTPWRILSSYSGGASFVLTSLEGDVITPQSVGGSIWQDPGFRAYRNLSEVVGPEGGTYYMSFMMLAGYQSALDLSYGSDWNAGVKIAVKTSQDVGVYMNVAGVNATPELTPIGESHFYVLKMELGEGPDTISIFVDPPMGIEPVAADAVVTTSSDIMIDRVRYSLYSDGGTFGGLDEFRIGETYSDVTPSSSAAINISPSNGTVNVSVDALLEWQVGNDPNDSLVPWDAVAGYYLYFGDDPNQMVLMTPEALPVTTTSYDPELAMDTSYYWQIEETFDNGLGGVYIPGEPNGVLGAIWNFQTQLSVPIINEQPTNVKVDEGSEAVFSVDVSSVSEVHYAWRHSTDGVIGDDSPVGGDSPTLVLSGVGISDEGVYYCVVTNNGPAVVNSDMAILSVKGLLSWYQFENNTDDSAGDNDGTLIPGTMSYTTGVTTTDGQAYAADPNGSFCLELPAGTYPKAGFGNGIEEFTYSVWIKLADETQGGSLFGAFNAANNMTLNFAINQTAGDIEFFLRNGSSVSNAVDNLPMYDNQWHLVAVTNNGSQVISYFDGLPQKAVSNGLTGYQDWEFGMKMLALDYHGATDKRFNGSVDDLRIYNYALNSEEIAQMYYDTSGQSVCLYGNPFADLSGDCIVNLDDFALMCQNWLTDGLYPN